LGTGAFGPVVLYEYGVDPATLKAQTSARVKCEVPELSYRPLEGQAPDEFDEAPATSPRSNRQLTLTTTWLERVNAYLAAMQSAPKNPRIPTAAPK